MLRRQQAKTGGASSENRYSLKTPARNALAAMPGVAVS